MHGNTGNLRRTLLFSQGRTAGHLFIYLRLICLVAAHSLLWFPALVSWRFPFRFVQKGKVQSGSVSWGLYSSNNKSSFPPSAAPGNHQSAFWMILTPGSTSDKWNHTISVFFGLISLSIMSSVFIHDVGISFRFEADSYSPARMNRVFLIHWWIHRLLPYFAVVNDAATTMDVWIAFSPYSNL